MSGDVARREVDAVVNAWNRNVIPAWLLLPQGVSKAIRKAGDLYNKTRLTPRVASIMKKWLAWARR